MLVGCAGFVLACAAITQVSSMHGFNGLRLIQGMGLGFVIAVSYPAIQEIFPESAAVKVMALLGNLALLSPLLGPLAGGLLLQWLSWRELFMLLAGLGLVSWLALWWFMPRTIHGVPAHAQASSVEAFDLRSLVRRYGALLGHVGFMSASVALGLMSLPLIAWIARACLHWRTESGRFRFSRRSSSVISSSMRWWTGSVCARCSITACGPFVPVWSR
jgi:DHA1 family multidrug/chloramphenicol efflux transport protein-like MFS transporter